MKALLVDPNEQRATALARALESSGAEVTVAPSASFALTMLEWNKQDVIVSRARLGDMDGHELCAIVRSDPSTKDVRFVLVVGPGENAPSQTAAAGVDLLLPDALSHSTVVTRVVQVVRRPLDSTTPTVAPAASTPSLVFTPPPLAPRQPVSPPAPPRPIAPPPQVIAPAEPVLPPIAPPPIAPPPIAPPPIAPPPIAPPPTFSAPPPVATPPPIETPTPIPPPAPAAAPPAPVAAGPTMVGLDTVGTNGGARTFQGALGVLEIEELTQAIAVGGKTGRLVLVLSTGGGLVVFETGRVTHAEFGGQAGETAFSTLVAASHRERGGKFCFIPVHPNDLRGQPKTIDRAVDQLLLDVARAIDEERRA
jgi:CheY-like chemotaxis protein